MTDHSVAPADMLVWNIVPWLRPGNAGQSLRVADLDRGLKWLGKLAALCPDLSVVLAGGRYAQRALDRPANPLDIARIDAPHPSPLTQNQRHYRRQLDETFARFASHLGEQSDP